MNLFGFNIQVSRASQARAQTRAAGEMPISSLVWDEIADRRALLGNAYQQVVILDPARFQHIVEDNELIGWRYVDYARTPSSK